MPLRDLLTQAKSRADSLLHPHRNDYNNTASQAPPIPPNKPRPTPISQSPPPKPYWTASFDPTTPVTSNFKHQLGAGGWGNNELQTYVSSPTNSFHTTSNALTIRALAPSQTPPQYTSARLTSHTTLNRPRGSLTFKATIPHAKGIWPAVWLLPREPFEWPEEGEVDVLETWDGDGVNRSCLHWGRHCAEERERHRVVETRLLARGGGVGGGMRSSTHEFDFIWEEIPTTPKQTRFLYLIDSHPVMRTLLPPGARPISDFQIIINVAIGGDVCHGNIPDAGQYDLTLHNLSMCEEPQGVVGGWKGFGGLWDATREGVF